MGKILHILTDEKFTDYVINQFEAPEMYSEFVLIPTNFLKGESEVKQLNKVRTIRYPSEDFINLLKHLGDYSGLILHGLNWKFDEDILRAVPDNVKVAWMFWGGEIYSRSELNDFFLAPLTKIVCYIHSWKKKDSHSFWQLPIKLYQRIDYCLTDIEEEFIFAKQYTKTKMQHLWYNYYSLEETVGCLMQSHCTGRNVFFCNSAAEKNNMFDALWRLVLPWNRRKLRGTRIIMPLSYGAPWIRNAMIKLGRLFFRGHFVPIVDYLPREEYNKLMLDCNTIILPYWQPAAQGNIITSLWLGMRVYLSERSMTYTFFKRIGAKIFSFESDFKKYGCTPITEEDFQINRAVIEQWYSKEHMMQCVKNVVDKLQ